MKVGPTLWTFGALAPFSLAGSPTPASTVFYCLGVVSPSCPRKFFDFECICAQRAKFLKCLALECPYGNFLEARDHYLGTCIERLPHLGEDPLYNVDLGGYENGLPIEDPVEEPDENDIKEPDCESDDGDFLDPDGDYFVGDDECEEEEDDDCEEEEDDDCEEEEYDDCEEEEDNFEDDNGQEANGEGEEEHERNEIKDDETLPVDCIDDHYYDDDDYFFEWCDENDIECQQDDEEEVQDYLWYKRRFLGLPKNTVDDWKEDNFWQAEKDAREAILREYGLNSVGQKQQQSIQANKNYASDTKDMNSKNKTKKVHNALDLEFAAPSKVFASNMSVKEVKQEGVSAIAIKNIQDPALEPSVESNSDPVLEDCGSEQNESNGNSNQGEEFDPSSLAENNYIPFRLSSDDPSSDSRTQVASRRKRVKKKFTKHVGVKNERLRFASDKLETQNPPQAPVEN